MLRRSNRAKVAKMLGPEGMKYAAKGLSMFTVKKGCKSIYYHTTSTDMGFGETLVSLRNHSMTTGEATKSGWELTFDKAGQLLFAWRA